MPDSSAPLQIGQPGNIPWVNAVHTLDSRQQSPSTWDEVYLLRMYFRDPVSFLGPILSLETCLGSFLLTKHVLRLNPSPQTDSEFI